MEIKRAGGAGDEDDVSQVEQVRLTVPVTDDPSLPVWTFRMWTMGFLSCALLSFLNQFFAYRSEPIVISQIFIQEHVLISIFANAGASFGGGNAYAIGIITIIKAFYKHNISFVTSLLLVITTQVLGYWAGLMRKYVVEPAHMWWPVSLVQVCLMRAMHEKEKRRMTRGKFFLIALICSFAWYTVPGYLFPTLTAVSWVCWVFPKSITMQQTGSGLNGLGIGAFTLDWSMVVSWLGSPLVTPFFATANVLVGYILLVYIMLSVAYWVLNIYSASRYPLFSNELFDASGQLYNIVNDKFEIDMDAYAKQGRIHLNLFFAVSYGLGFATIAATLSHVTFFYGKEMYQRFRESYKGKMDVHARLMKRYDDIPN
ncbi:Oligopeptide transporter 4 [Hordeum vulgare]|nr:Oligopeptide transporter 4 [Hordeum vulgare]